MPHPIIRAATTNPAVSKAIATSQTVPVGNLATSSAPQIDQFDAAPARSEPLPLDAETWSKSSVQKFALEIEERKRNRLMTDVIVSCVSPFLTPKAVLEDQVGLMLLRILGKIESERMENEFAMGEFDRLQKEILAKQDRLISQQKERLAEPLLQLQKMGESLKSQQQGKSEEQNRSVQALSSISANQHQAIMASLREMRGF